MLLGDDHITCIVLGLIAMPVRFCGGLGKTMINTKISLNAKTGAVCFGKAV